MNEKEWVAVAVQRQESEQQQPHRAAVRPAVHGSGPTAAQDTGPGPHRPGGRLSPAQVTALQRSAGNTAVARALQQADEAEPAVQRSTETSVHEVLRTPGAPLAEPVRRDMESRLGADFSAVRVHADTTAQRSAAEIGARAYTSGNHIVVGAGGDDQHTLAHELTHVIQQRSGAVAGTDHGAGLRISDPSDRFEREAEANATRALAGPAAPGAHDSAPPDEAAAEGSSSAVH
ncbi:eCIS core domain-containing protein [Streptomyces odontomachi]|uniref:eCIS core domain-containing protein n=1 Tax=Streptomyces odontomachi TaxID=2944940 RepID=UPI0035A8F77D